MNFRIACFPLLFSAFLLTAQETEGTSYTAHVGVTYTSGNSTSEQINLGFNAKKVTENTELTLNSYYDYGRTEETTDGETQEVTNLDKGRIEAQGNHLLSETNYIYISISAEKDEIAGIDRRVATGPGLGHYFRRDDTLTLSAEGGLVWVFEEIDEMTDDYAAFRLAQNLKWAIGEGSRIRQDVEIIADVSDEENYFINAKVVAEASLTALLALRAEVRNSYNNQPGQGKEQNDITLLTGITVSW